MSNLRNLFLKKNFANVIKQGFCADKEQMEWFYQEMGNHMEDQILSPEVFNLSVSALKTYKKHIRDYRFYTPYDITAFCSSVWQINKMDVDFSKIYEQFMAVPFEKSEDRNIYFFELYLRYLQELQEAKKEGLNIEDYGLYFPDGIVEEGIEAMTNHLYALSDAVKAAVYSHTIAELAEEYKEVEMTFECDGVSYIAKVPRSSSEIVDEAAYMRNCIASRMYEYCKRQWVYVFIRKADNPNKPFIDALIYIYQAETRGIRPTFVITKNHNNVIGSPNEPIFNKWYEKAEGVIKRIVGVCDGICCEV